MGRGSGLRRRLGLTAAALGLMAVVTAGCGADGPTPLDIGAVERQVPGVLLPGHPDLVADVDCGDPVPTGLGPMPCTAVVSGVEVPVIVHGPALDGRIRVESPADVVAAVDLSGRVAARLQADIGVEARVACTPAVRVAFAGQTFDCVATDPDARDIDLVATLIDADGGFRLDASPGSG